MRFDGGHPDPETSSYVDGLTERLADEDMRVLGTLVYGKPYTV